MYLLFKQFGTKKVDKKKHVNPQRLRADYIIPSETWTTLLFFLACLDLDFFYNIYFSLTSFSIFIFVSKKYMSEDFRWFL